MKFEKREFIRNKARKNSRFASFYLNVIILVPLLCFLPSALLWAQEPASEDKKSLRIAVIADSQLTTEQKTSHYLFRTQQADALANVAVRTPAQEHLASVQLAYMLDDLAKNRPDILLYLGDGANSGCRDEVDGFFKILREKSNYHRVPIFFVIGNHDYLATGNQSDRYLRGLACGGNNYYTKAEVVRLTAAFNFESWNVVSKEGNILTGYSDSLADVDSDTGSCRVVQEDQHTEGCFYAAIVNYEKQGVHGRIVLLDTSDYRDLDFNPQVSLPFLSNIGEVRGLRGAISFGPNSQTEWVKTRLEQGHAPANIFFASHYPTTDLRWSFKRLGFGAGQIGSMFSASSQNVWLSAHTHRPSAVADHGILRDQFYTKKERDGTKWRSPCYDELNIGSTTDHRAHAAIVEMQPNRIEGETHCMKSDVRAVKATMVVAMEEQSVPACRLKIDTFNRFLQTPEGEAAGYGYPMTRLTRLQSSAYVRLGLTTHYRSAYYKPTTARRNLDLFLMHYAKDQEEYERMVRCLMFLSAEKEAG